MTLVKVGMGHQKGGRVDIFCFIHVEFELCGGLTLCEASYLVVSN